VFDDLFNRIRAALPSLVTLTNEESALLEAWLGDHPEPPSYACSEVRRGILSVWDETDPSQMDFWTLLRATLRHNQGRTVPAAPQPAPPVAPPREQPTIALPIAPSPAQPGDAEIYKELTTEPGALIYRRHREALPGKPLECLRALISAHGRPLDVRQIQTKVWGDEPPEESTVKSHVCKARQALQRAMEAESIIDPADPIPNVDHGMGRTAWRLDLP
jgi:hypothetical protein